MEKIYVIYDGDKPMRSSNFGKAYRVYFSIALKYFQTKSSKVIDKSKLHIVEYKRTDLCPACGQPVKIDDCAENGGVQFLHNRNRTNILIDALEKIKKYSGHEIMFKRPDTPSGYYDYINEVLKEWKEYEH